VSPRKKTAAKSADPVQIASKGGKARARTLSADQKSQIARKGAQARWKDKPVTAERVGTIRLGAAEIPCANLPGGMRVLSEASIMNALGRGYSGYYSQRDATAEMGDAIVHRAVSPAVLRPYIPAALAEALSHPIAYRVAGKGGIASKGIPAEALPMLLDVWIKARDAKVLTPRQTETADKCEILRLGLARVGIVALVDEATGAQVERARDALARYLEAYVTKELAAWEKTFPDDFYKAIFRLRGWPEESYRSRPGVVGKWTANIVYARLGPGILDRLHEIVPRDERGHLKFKLHRALTRDMGVIALGKHLAAVTTLARAAVTVSTDPSKRWAWYLAQLDEIHPRLDSDQLRLNFMPNNGSVVDDESDDADDPT
jgi:hypothetical protein